MSNAEYNIITRSKARKARKALSDEDYTQTTSTMNESWDYDYDADESSGYCDTSILPMIEYPPSKKRKFINSLSHEELEYFLQLPNIDQDKIVIRDNDIRTHKGVATMPLRFKILNSDMDNATKLVILSKLENFQKMHEGTGEHNKLRNWLSGVSRLPLGSYNKLQVDHNNTATEISSYLKGVRKTLDETVYGHKDAKEQVMRILAQWISNPTAKGTCIGIQGAMGVGKTNLVKEGICKALGLPFGFIALGGACDGSFLEGHGFTYEGSTYGKIAEVLMKSQVMNPVIFFDELDKVSQTRRGEEIIGILTHLTDSSQNERFSDKYFGEIEFDLSKCLIIFSYNDESLVNPILKDRMSTIHVSGYNTKDKLSIAKDYLIPRILEEFHMKNEDVSFDDSVIRHVIENCQKEEGVRNLKRSLESIIGWINISKYLPEKDPLEFPFNVTKEHVDKCLKKNNTNATSRDSIIHHSMYT